MRRCRDSNSDTPAEGMASSMAGRRDVMLWTYFPNRCWC
jgi:hypothetical protein